MTNPERKPQTTTISGLEISSAISGGYLVGSLFGPIYALPGFILGGVAARLYENPSAREAVARFISEHKPK